MDNKVVILNFSPRNDGNCGRVCEFVADHYKRTNVCLHHVQMTPCSGCNYECLTPGVSCPQVSQHQKEVMDAVCNSDIVYFVVPNFCGYPCANYFSFNERTVGYFNLDRELTNRYMAVKKRFIMISNSEGDNFKNAMSQQTKEEPVMFYLKSGKYKKRSTAGDIMDSEEARNDLQAFLNENP